MKRLVLLLLLAGCTSEKPAATLADVARGIQLSPVQAAALQRASDACPGITAYAQDITLKEVNPLEGSAAWDVIFDVQQLPSSIPSEFQASGNTCYIEVRGDEVTTGKKACASVCLKRLHPGSVAPYDIAK